MDASLSDARRRLIHLLAYIAEADDVKDFDGTSEAAYGALYSMGLDETPQMQVGSLLQSDWEAAAIDEFVRHLDAVLSAYGNCETETNNLKMAAWARAREAAQSAFDLLTNEPHDE